MTEQIKQIPESIYNQYVIYCKNVGDMPTMIFNEWMKKEHPTWRI